MKSLRGQLLIASQDLLDPNFLKTVILMVQHNSQGALGLVLNRPTNTTLDQVLDQVSDISCQRDEPLHLGGPCQGSLMVVHCEKCYMDLEILPNVYFSGESENVEQLVRIAGGPAKFFVGFAGWEPGQLESEINIGSWRTTPATVDYVFHSEGDLWKTTTKQMARRTLSAVLNLKHVPEDPSVN